MSTLVCNYAVLRFLPYRETGEFVNVGVVVFCPQAGFFGFQSERRRRGRVGAFFPELDRAVFRDGLREVQTELNRQRRIFARRLIGNELLAEMLNQFRDLVRVREGLFQFGASGVLLAESPAEAVTQLYGQFVLRQFAQHAEYQETVMRRRLDDFLQQWHLRRFYRVNRPVGDERFHITFPFVHGPNAQARKVLKPLDLDRKESTEIYQHADTWLNALRRLQKIGKAPQETVFPVRLPMFGHQRTAADEVTKELEAIGAIIVPMEDEGRLRVAVNVPDHHKVA